MNNGKTIVLYFRDVAQPIHTVTTIVLFIGAVWWLLNLYRRHRLLRILEKDVKEYKAKNRLNILGALNNMSARKRIKG